MFNYSEANLESLNDDLDKTIEQLEKLREVAEASLT